MLLALLHISGQTATLRLSVLPMHAILMKTERTKNV